MVFIVPSSGCLAVDIKNAARQMINVEQNAQLFSSEVKSCKDCSCVETGEHATKGTRPQKDPALKFVGSTEKVHVYSVTNPVYPEYPMTIEPISMIGTVLIYLPKVLGHKISNKVNLSNRIRDEVDRVILDYFRNDDIDFKDTLDAQHTYNGIRYESELDSGTVTSRFTMVSKPYDINVNRKILYRSRSAVASANKDTFIWNVRIITEGDISMYDFLNVAPKPNGNYYATHTVYSKRQWLFDQYDRRTPPDNMSAKETTALKVFNSLNSYIKDSAEKWGDISHMMYAPNLIILDCAGLLTNRIVQYGGSIIKQINNPDISQFKTFKLIDIDYDWRHQHGIDRAIETEYAKDHGIVPKFDFNYIGDSSKFMESLLKSARINKAPTTGGQVPLGTTYQITQTSLYCEDTYDEQAALVYHLQFACREPSKSDAGYVELDCTLSANLKQIVTLAKSNAKLKTFATHLNESDQVCFITGTPLWGHYFEFQFVCTIKISPRKTQQVIVCMSLSKRGILLLYGTKHKCVYPDTDRVRHFRGYEFDLFLMYLFTVRNKYECSNPPNIIIKKADRERGDVIALLKNKKNKLLLESMNKFGIVHYSDNLYVVNPETNDIFIGVDSRDITDQFILEMKNSDAYIFRVSNSRHDLY
jgi:hypothetical protein